MKVSIVRGAFLNPFELQNYYPLPKEFDIQVISSLHPINENIALPIKKLISPTDLPNFPFKYPILNRIFTDAHQLYGLEKEIAGSDIVHVAETYFGYTQQAISAKRKGLIRKVISTVWEVIPFNNEGIRGRKQAKYNSYQFIDHFLAVTNMARNALIKEGVNPRKITVIPMGVDIDRFKPDKNKKSKKNIEILFVGRLVPEKGVEKLINAFNELKTNYPIKLTLVGDGPLRKSLQGISGLTIKNIPYNLIHKVYQQADIFCLPSQTTKYWQEQYGMVLVEAMASGLPIVTTNSGAIPEVCQNLALYSPPKNQTSLKNNLQRLITDDLQRSQLAAKSRELAKNKYDYHKTAKMIKNIYQAVYEP